MYKFLGNLYVCQREALNNADFYTARAGPFRANITKLGRKYEGRLFFGLPDQMPAKLVELDARPSFASVNRALESEASRIAVLVVSAVSGARTRKQPRRRHKGK